MDVLNHPLTFGVAAAAGVFLLWGEVLVFSSDKETRAKLIRYQFVLLVEAIVVFLNILVFNVSQRVPALRAFRTKPLVWIRNAYGAFFIVVCSLAQISWLSVLIPQLTEPRPVIYLAWCAMGVVLLYVFCSTTLTISWSISLKTLPPNRRMSEARFLNYRALFSLIYAVVIGGIAIRHGLQLPVVKEVPIEIKDFPESLDGFVIAQIADVHLGPTSGASRLRKVVDITNEIEPDLVILTGDLVDGVIEDLAVAVKELGRLRAKHGVFFVTGNHEYLSGHVDALMAFLLRYGVRSLHNSHVKIWGNSWSDYFWLLGVDDIFADSIKYTDHGYNLAAALKGIDEEHPRILIAHQPKAIANALKSGARIDLGLCAHTHGGQYIPNNIVQYMLNPYFRGLYRNQGPRHDAQVYVTEGTLFFGYPIRLASSMEITKIVLQTENSSR